MNLKVRFNRFGGPGITLRKSKLPHHPSIYPPPPLYEYILRFFGAYIKTIMGPLYIFGESPKDLPPNLITFCRAHALFHPPPPPSTNTPNHN